LEGRGAAAQAAEPPQSPVFGMPEMRPNEVLPESHIFVNSLLGEALYTRIEDLRILHPQMDTNIIGSVNGGKKMVNYNTIGRTCTILL
jgi:hypothetical protein